MSWRTRSGALSRVGSSMRANCGIHLDTGSSSDSLPSSRSFSTASAVKLLVIEAMRNAVEEWTGSCDERSRTPNVPTCARRASITTPQTMPGIFFSSA